MGPPQAGKAQPHRTPVLTPTGWRKIGELVPGDLVIGGDGRPVQAVAVHERGIREVFQVSLDDGTSTVACGDHLWTVHPHALSSRTIDTRTLRNRVATNKRFGMLPVVAPVEYTPAGDLPLGAYLLGLLLGDGGLTGDGVVITLADDELVEAVRAALPAGARITRKGSPRDKNGKLKYGYGIYGTKHWRATGTPPVTAALRQLGLHGHRTEDKFIPESYLHASVEDRKALLAGLLDTDGGMEGNSVTFTTVSPKLADDVRELVLSLGGCVRVRTKNTSYVNYAGERITCRTAYRLSMRLPYGNPFRLARKRERYDDHAKNLRPPNRRIVSVEPEGLDNVRCITVANPDGLYVTENFIVTHNSTSMLLMTMPPRSRARSRCPSALK
ncbi:LAGLIDADG family homing endonuclease [Planotetraspora silvatica]|uniref:LAGLIDADG family homing endonuclease n=1 Tax=Planotetraspora silvatica TaxID=234614 RepID=UPI001951D2C1|nr:LAGLIDADG family homing endonuclease [Planotetraspora silvatica]